MRKGSEVVAFRVLLALALATAVGCAPRLGDSCDVSTDCSVQQDRDCDTSAPGGYCTIENCIEGDCLGEGYCVRFEPDQSRRSSSWCMARCKRGCRDDYRCVSADDLNVERCGSTPAEAEEWRDAYAGNREGLEADLLEYLEELEAWREAGADPDEEPEEPTAAKLTDLEVCLAAQPRAAEVLDSNSDATFCVQGEEPAPESARDAQSDAERMSTAP